MQGLLGQEGLEQPDWARKQRLETARLVAGTYSSLWEPTPPPLPWLLGFLFLLNMKKEVT